MKKIRGVLFFVFGIFLITNVYASCSLTVPDSDRWVPRCSHEICEHKDKVVYGSVTGLSWSIGDADDGCEWGLKFNGNWVVNQNDLSTIESGSNGNSYSCGSSGCTLEFWAGDCGVPGRGPVSGTITAAGGDCSIPCSGTDTWVNASTGWGECNLSGIQTLISTCTDTGTCSGGCSPVGSTITYSRSCTFLDKPYFASLTQPNQNISSTDLGDTVLVRFPGVNFQDKNITYYVYVFNGSGSTWWNPFTWFGGKKQWNSLPKVQGSPIEPFTIGRSDIHRINASKDEVEWKLSNNLTINSTVNNSPPNATIGSPFNNCNYTINTPVRFNQSSGDEDDLLKIIWDFGDGTSNYVVENYSKVINSTAADTTHNYTRIGPKIVKLTAQDYRSSNSKSDTDQITINIVKEGISVVPVISNPLDSSVHGNGSVYFNANQSYVLNCTSGNMLNPDFTTCDGLLNCSYIHRPGDIPPYTRHPYTLYLNWSFGDGKYNAGYWYNESHLNLTSFTHTYLTASEHKIKLNMKFNWTG